MPSAIRNIFNAAYILLFLLCCSFNQAVTAQETSHQIRFTRFSIDEGLPPGNVNDIIQDSLGLIWLGTESGLCRFDGYEFTTYFNIAGDSTSLSHNHVFSLLKDSKGIIWVGTLGGGLNKFDIATGRVKRFLHDENNPHSISNNIIYRLYRDSKNRIWISTLGGGLNLFDPETETFTRFNHSSDDPESFPDNMVSALYEDREGNFWVGTFNNGLILFDPEEPGFIKYANEKNNKYSISHNRVMDILEDSGGRLWIATFGGGVNLFDREAGRFFNASNYRDFPVTTSHPNIRKLLEADEYIWVGTYNGLYRFSKNDFTKEKFLSDKRDIRTINNNKIREIFADRNGVIWIGTTEGVSKYYPGQKKFELYRYSENYTSELGKGSKIPLTLNTTSVLWPELKSGVIVSKSNTGRIIRYYGNLPDGGSYVNSVSTAFYRDENGVLWFGSYDGLKYYDKKSKEYVFARYEDDGFSSLKNNFIKCFYIDRRNNFWAGSLAGGLNHYDPATNVYHRFLATDTTESPITDSRVMSVLEDSHGNFWIGTYGGLNLFDREKKTFKSYLKSSADSSSISNDRIYSIFESSKRELWIGTYNGLNRYNRDKDNFERYTEEKGIAGNIIYGILEDDSGALWMRTEKGISKFDEAENIFKNYDYRDGLDGMELNGTAYFKNSDGKMFFGGTNGFNAFYPEDISDNPRPPEIVFSSFKIMGDEVRVGNNSPLLKPINEIEELVLSYKDELISFEIAALDYAIPSKNKYAYRLTGYRDDWVYLDADNRTITFTMLNPGEYELQIKGTNNDGVWNNTPRTLKLTITPPFWNTWLFRIAVLAVVLIIIFIFYEIRLKRLLEIERTRIRIAGNLHDDVGGALSSIQYFAKALGRENIDPDRTEKFTNLIIECTADAQDKIKDIIWTVNPEEDDLEKLIIKFNRYASDLLESNNIKYEIDYPTNNILRSLDMEKRQHIWCICKETLINVIKHADCQNVKINFQISGRTLTYTIEDDGIGFDTEKNHDGNGVDNIKKRVELISADYSVNSSKNYGTKWNFHFKI